MLRFGTITVELDTAIEIDGYSSDEYLGSLSGIEADDIHYMVDTFEVSWSQGKDNYFILRIKPIGSYNNIPFHSTDFLMTFDEISDVYKNINGFIETQYTLNNCVFNQDIVKMMIEKHNIDIEQMHTKRDVCDIGNVNSDYIWYNEESHTVMKVNTLFKR